MGWDDEIRKALNRDPIAEAEKIAGRRTEASMWVGLALVQDNARDKEALLSLTGDSYSRAPLKDYLRVITKAGFEKCLEIDFVSSTGRSSADPEKYFVFFQSENGILLSFDTYTWPKAKPTVNSGNFYYNWQPNTDTPHRCTSSGSYITYDKEKNTGIWGGSHDCREAILFNIRQLKENGKFLTPWVERPWLWLLHHGDSRVPGYDHKMVTEARIKMLPEHVQTCISPGKPE